MNRFFKLKEEIQNTHIPGTVAVCDTLYVEGLKDHYFEPEMIAKAKALSYMFEKHEKYVYENDLILGSYKGLFVKSLPKPVLEHTKKFRYLFGKNGVNEGEKGSHYAPDYEYVLSRGIGGIIEDIEKSKIKHADDSDKVTFLDAARISIEGLGKMLHSYGEKALSMGKKTEAEICFRLERSAPETFREALQLMWMCHISFYCEFRVAMALGRVDRFLYPYFKKDIENGIMTREDSLVYFASMIMKMKELQKIFKERSGTFNTVDVVNICVGGVDRKGNPAENELTFVVIDAVRECGICGPNLSARVSSKASDRFWDECLKSIGTGIGYPALMNDEINIAALSRWGYDIEDCRDYAMVGCIENFLPGLQPPWNDGGVNGAKELEYAINNGRCALCGAQMGPKTGEAEEFDTMEKLLKAFKEQIKADVEENCVRVNMTTTRGNEYRDRQPYLSCFARTCIERGLDIYGGGCKYPSVFGLGATGVATVADSLAAIEKLVYEEKVLTLSELRDILNKDFEGYDDIRTRLLKAPKYGNNDDYADKYASMFVDMQFDARKNMRTFDGGFFYMSIASNVNNIREGENTGATADGRRAHVPLSDAASPMRGMDKNGLTQAMLSVSKADYTKTTTGTVYNIKLTKNMFTDTNKRNALRDLIKVYFMRGGQEVQINCISREILKDAMENPENYGDMVVRVSGFSSVYTTLSTPIQKDILERTEHD
ncbi:MAG: hypothetical protein II998_00120 [Clostridia bacterium]|nr:hypothetical protein [Clostridia bacterium]